MEITDHKVGVPTEHYRAVFAAADPEALSGRSGVPYADGKFSLTLLGRPVTVSWPEMEARFSDDGAAAAPNTRIVKTVRKSIRICHKNRLLTLSSAK